MTTTTEMLKEAIETLENWRPRRPADIDLAVARVCGALKGYMAHLTVPPAPVLPEEPTQEIISAIKLAMALGNPTDSSTDGTARVVFHQLRRELTAPKEVQVERPAKEPPLSVTIEHTGTNANHVIETCVEVLVRAGMLTVDGAIGERINRRIADSKPKKMKPVFHCEGTDNSRHGPPGTVITADWHDVNQAIGALSNDGYRSVIVRREMVPE